ncbi:MAG TPA: hypothetical protein VF077_12660 [Nitrospiraceae bacterium]
MPYTARDADRHKKGLSAKQKRQWAAVANSVLAACIKDGGTDASCAGKAIQQANGVVGTPATMHRLTVQTALTAPTRNLTVHDCEYVVAPGVLIVEGVLNGGFIPASALVPDDWDWIPITLSHPRDAQGNPISANDPAVLSAYSVGHLAQCRLGTGQRGSQTVCSLRAMLYLDQARIAQMGDAAQATLARLQAQEPCDVSTGFYSTSIPAQGQFAGALYTEIHQSLTPDHLALLPDEEGACSWSNGGCGVPRLHEAETTCACETPDACTCGQEPVVPAAALPRLQRFWSLMQRFFHEDHAVVVVPDEPALQTEQTDADVREALQGCLMREMGEYDSPMWIDEINSQDQYFTYHKRGGLYRRYWQTQDGLITLMEGEEPVQRVTDYVPIPATMTEEEPPVAGLPVPNNIIKSHANWLIANGAQTGWSEDHRHMLEGMTEAALLVLRGLPKQAPPRASETLTVEDALATLPAELRESHLASHREYERRKAGLVTQVLAHKHNPYTEVELRGKNVEFLTSLLAMAGEETAPQGTYEGRRMPSVRVVQDEDDQPPPLPNTLELVVQRQRALGLRP